MNKKLKYTLVFIVCMFFVVILSGCSAGDATNYNNVEETLKTTQKSSILSEVDKYIDFNKMNLTDDEKTNVNSKLVAVKSELNTNFDYSKTEELLTKALTDLYNAIPEDKKSEVKEVSAAVKEGMENELNALKVKSSELTFAYTTKKSKEDREYHQEYLCNEALVVCTEQIQNAKTAVLAGKTENKETESEDIYQIVKNYTILVGKYEIQEAPLQFYGGSEFWSHLFNNLIVFPIGWLIQAISHLFGRFYILGLLIVTILVRTLGWPIYAKTNDMSLKMSLMQPEQQKIEEKYANRPDPESQRMKQMEQMQLYKKYKVGLGGCLMPFIQMPLFIGFYRTISRMPYSIKEAGNWIGSVFKTTQIFGIDMVLQQNQGFNELGEIIEATGWTNQKIGVLVLAILVGITQLISIILSNMRQKKQQENQVSALGDTQNNGNGKRNVQRR